MEDQKTQLPTETVGTDTPAQPEPSETPAMDMAAALAEAEGRMAKEIRKGQIVKGRVVFVGSEGVAVDIGTKVEGVIPFAQLTNEPLSEEELKSLLKPGDEVEVYVLRVDPDEGQIILSKKRAEADKAWKKIAELYEKGEPIEVVPVERVKGGLVAYVEGQRAFIPASQVDLKKNADLDAFVGQPIQAKIIELNRKKGRIILSRRVLLEEEEKAKRRRMLESLEPGQEVEGKVVEVTDFGAFVNLGPVDGLVHRTELSWGRFNHPREVIKVGDQVKAKVVSVDPERERINLSIKAATPNPWEVVTEKYQVGDKVRGKVVGLTPFGAFVEIEPGLEGLIHITEMSWTKRPKHPSEVVKEGEEVEAQILKIDPEARRLSLGLRQLLPDPWKELPDKYPPGTVIKGRVTGITPFGVFVEIEPGIEGLIHISELDYQRVENPAVLFKEGDEVEAVILQIDPAEQRISLSRKRLLEPPVPTEEEKKRRAKGKGRPKAKGKGPRDRRPRPAEVGVAAAYQQYDASVASPSTASVKLGDLYGDLLKDLGLEDTAEAEG